MTDPIADADKMPAEHYRSLADLEGRYWWHQTRYRLACEVVSRHRPAFRASKIADVGCGTGGFLRHLRGRGFESIAGFDFSAAHLESLAREGIVARTVDLESPFALEGAPYDVITALDVLEHLQDERGFVRAVRANVRPGGLLFLTIPAHGFLFSEWDRRLKHFRRYSRRPLGRLLEENGFRVLESSYFFSFVFPLALARRWVGAFDGREACEFPPMPNALNGALLALGALEVRALRSISLPVGTSLFALGEASG